MDSERTTDNEKEDSWRINNLVSNIGMVSVQGTSDPRYLGSTSGISFARVVFAAIKSSVNGNTSERGPTRPTESLPHSATGTGGSTMRDSFFGLQTRPSMKCAPFPDRELAEKLANLYLEHANPQMPIVHREEFMAMLDRTFLTEEKSRSPRNLYTLNIVFAIGAGIIFQEKTPEGDKKNKDGRSPSQSSSKRPRLSGHQCQPEEYHASAIVHLESFLDSSSTSDGGGLEELQAVLLLASFALLRPVAPGLWYIVGVAMRLAVDLGLHYEDGAGIDYPENIDLSTVKGKHKSRLRIDTRERGRREWVRDLRRRLWWCVYSFDRLVGCCVGRPFGISDQAISTQFPSSLEDKYITRTGITTPPEGAPSYKHAGFHYFKLRLLQSEIQDVLQYQQARFAKQSVPYSGQPITRSELCSPYLQGFDSFRSWRKDVHRRLAEWQKGAPTRQDTGVRFPVELLELNYWQAVIMLYQQSLAVPAELAGELTPAEDVSSPSLSNMEDADDEQDIYLNVAEAGQKVIRIYRQLHRVRLVNYTYLATHHIFMAGKLGRPFRWLVAYVFRYFVFVCDMAFACCSKSFGRYPSLHHWHALTHSQTLDEVDFTVLAATSVLGDLVHLCPPAEACRDAFERMSKATVQMCLSTTGFGSQVDLTRPVSTITPRAAHAGRSRQYEQQKPPRRQTQRRQSRPMPRFDMSLGDLFDDDGSNPERPSTRRRIAQSYPTRSEYPEQSSPSFTSDGSRPYLQGTSPMDYYKYDNPVSPQQHQQYYYGNSPPHTTSPGSAATTASQHHLNSVKQENQPGFSLDFLDFDSTGAEGPVPMDTEGNVDYSVLNMPSLGHGAGHSVGIDLGFGMAMDFQHDWSENANYDMLEGYFFGSGAGTGPSGEE